MNVPGLLLKTVKDVIKVNDLKTVEEITNYTKAGAFCKSCIKPGGHEERKYYLEDILPGYPGGDGKGSRQGTGGEKRF